MCFGDRTNPEIHAGTDNLDKTHTRASDYADQHYPNRPVKASKSAGGWFANTPAGKSNALIKAMPKEELKQNRKKWVQFLNALAFILNQSQLKASICLYEKYTKTIH